MISGVEGNRNQSSFPKFEKVTIPQQKSNLPGSEFTFCNGTLGATLPEFRTLDRREILATLSLNYEEELRILSLIREM